MRNINAVLLADCKTSGASCTNQKCTAPGSVADGGACTAQTGKALRLVVVFSCQAAAHPALQCALRHDTMLSVACRLRYRSHMWGQKQKVLWA